MSEQTAERTNDPTSSTSPTMAVHRSRPVRIPGQRISCDHGLLLDSNFFEVDKLSSQTSREVIEKLKCQMARHGIPDKLRSDNGPHFSSQEFMKFSELYEFDHIAS